MEINQEYFDWLGEKLLKAMNSNILREEEWILFSQYRDMLCDNVLSLEQKKKVSVVVETMLSKYQDILKDYSDKVQGPSR